MEGHALAQRENPARIVLRVDMPFGCQGGLVGHFRIGGGQIPADQAFIEGIADEAVAFHALVGLAGPIGNIGCGHGDHDIPRLGGRGRAGRQKRRQPGDGQRLARCPEERVHFCNSLML